MSEFTRAIFASKEVFGPEDMKEFAALATARQRFVFVDSRVPEAVTHVPTVPTSRGEEEQEEQSGEEEEEEEQLKGKSHRLFSPHPRLRCLAECVRVEYSGERGRHLATSR